jgi:hypothetical protein
VLLTAAPLEWMLRIPARVTAVVRAVRKSLVGLRRAEPCGCWIRRPGTRDVETMKGFPGRAGVGVVLLGVVVFSVAAVPLVALVSSLAVVLSVVLISLLAVVLSV